MRRSGRTGVGAAGLSPATARYTSSNPAVNIRPRRRIIDFHIEHRWFVLTGVLGIVAAGVYSIFQIPVDAFPDLTNNQVVFSSDCAGMAPIDVEQLVTFPIETSLMGLPRTEGIRSISKLGLSIVTIVFDDSVPTYFARQLVNEKLQEARTRLPEAKST